MVSEVTVKEVETAPHANDVSWAGASGIPLCHVDVETMITPQRTRWLDSYIEIAT